MSWISTLYQFFIQPPIWQYSFLKNLLDFCFQMNNLAELLEEELEAEAQDPCNGKTCSANEHCCEGHVCVDTDDSKFFQITKNVKNKRKWRLITDLQKGRSWRKISIARKSAFFRIICICNSFNVRVHSVEISRFFCHLHFTWNQLWSFWSPQNCHFDDISSFEFWLFGNFLTFSYMNFFPKSKLKAYKIDKMAVFDLLKSARINFT